MQKQTKITPASAAGKGSSAMTKVQNPERQLALQRGKDIAPANAGFLSLRTLSGKSLGSLEQCIIDWNSADMSEVNTMHPAGPGMLAQKMHALKVAVNEAHRTAEVNIPFSAFANFCKIRRVKFTRLAFFITDIHHPQSPRFRLSNGYSVE